MIKTGKETNKQKEMKKWYEYCKKCKKELSNYSRRLVSLPGRDGIAYPSCKKCWDKIGPKGLSGWTRLLVLSRF